MSSKPWLIGDGDKTVETDALRRAFIYDRINKELIDASITTQAEWDAMGAYLGFAAGGSSRGDGTFGFFSFGDSGATGDIVITDTVCVPGYDVEQEPGITSLNFPNLTAIDPLNLQGGSLFCNSNTILTNLSVPELASVAGYVSFTSSAVLINLDFPQLVSVGAGFVCSSNNALTSLSVPQLTSVGGTFRLQNNPLLPNLSVPQLTLVAVDFSCFSHNALTSLSVPQLVSVGTNFNCTSNPALTTVDVSSWIPTDGTTIDFSGDALNATSIELILRRLVLAGVTTCTINLSGGTNAGTGSLNAQGQADVATLGAQLTINP